MPNLAATSRACSMSVESLWQGMITPNTPSPNPFFARTAATDESIPPLIPNTTPSAPASSTLSLIQLLIRSAVFIFPSLVTG